VKNRKGKGGKEKRALFRPRLQTNLESTKREEGKKGAVAGPRHPTTTFHRAPELTDQSATRKKREKREKKKGAFGVPLLRARVSENWIGHPRRPPGPHPPHPPKKTKKKEKRGKKKEKKKKNGAVVPADRPCECPILTAGGKKEKKKKKRPVQGTPAAGDHRLWSAGFVRGGRGGKRKKEKKKAHLRPVACRWAT